jgi:hypothetical protein
MNKEKWNKLCYHLSEKIVSDITERDFELLVDRALGILGWEEYSGDFEIRPSFQLGSTKNSLKPDFLIKSNSTGQKLFVVEIKRPKVPLSEQNQIQLSTYMRQFKLPFGILIGPEIQVFYDGLLNEQENAMQIGRIKFEKDLKDGEEFVTLFSKDSFSYEALHGVAPEFLKKNNQKTKIEELAKRITSDDFQDKTKELIKRHLIQEFESEVIDAALEKVWVKISLKESESSHRESPKSEYRERNWGNSSNDTIEIQLNPASESEFRRLLLITKTAYITTFFHDGTFNQKKWNAQSFTETSNVIGNLRSRPEFRKGNWQKLGIEKVYVSIEK